MKILTEIANECDALAASQPHKGKASFGTDKGSHGFASFYEECVGHLRDKPCKIMEVGVRTGGSIRMWEEGFPQAAIVGIDWNLGVCTLAPNRATLIQADVTKHGVLEAICAKHGPFDFLIDDAAHTPECSEAILACFPRHIVPGGWLFIEDTHVAGLTQWAKKLVDAVNHHGALRSCGRANWVEPRSEFDAEIDRIVMRPGIIGIQRWKP